jgi:4-hydroxyphenylacetate 3-monooxygenase
MASYYGRWYERHRDPAFADVFQTAQVPGEARKPLAFHLPRTSDDLRRIGAAAHFAAFETGGNVTHTPLYGNLIALGVLDAALENGVPQRRIDAVTAYREGLAGSGRFLTFSSGIGPAVDRFRAPNEAACVHVVKETDGGVVLSGVVGLHTATPFAHEVMILADALSPLPQRKAWVAVPVNAPGVQVLARRSARGRQGAFTHPFSNRFDELDATLWMKDVFVPWERVFALGPELRTPFGVELWLLWHQTIGFLGRAEFTLGLALAIADAQETRDAPMTTERLIDLVTATQTLRSLLAASELEPETSKSGYARPHRVHLAPAALHGIRVRKELPEVLRLLCGSSALTAPTEVELEGELGPGFEASFGGGRYNVRQRAALFHAAWDHISSALEGREHSYELFGNGGVFVWRERLKRWFDRYDDLANRAVATLDLSMPGISNASLRAHRAPPPRQAPPK